MSSWRQGLQHALAGNQRRKACLEVLNLSPYNNLMAEQPGTVSKILWHFTGGPSWDPMRKCQERQPKPASDAYSALDSILRSRELRLGNYAETVKVIIPEVHRFDEVLQHVVLERNVEETLESAHVCCLADIPIGHLGYHAQRYGKMALGFYRDSVIRHGFNPVLYTLHRSKVIRSIHQGLGELQFFDTDPIRHSLMNIEAALTEQSVRDGRPIPNGVDEEMAEINREIVGLDSAATDALNLFRRLLAFSKTFGEDEFATIYCEREWRSIRAYRFRHNDVAMIVLPREADGFRYFGDFVGYRAKELALPRSVAVVAWEDLIEYA